MPLEGKALIVPTRLSELGEKPAVASIKFVRLRRSLGAASLMPALGRS